MRVIRHVTDAELPARSRVVAVGTFDGLHRGHRAVLARVVERAAALGAEPAVVVTRGGADRLRLGDRRQQLEGLRAARVELVAFAPRAASDAAVERLAAVVRVIESGEAVRPPRGGRLEQITPVAVDGERISTAAIAAALARADLERARALLGRDPAVAGRIVHGHHRGAGLGIPTANLRIRDIEVPPDGVYAVRARLAEVWYAGVANVGFNPTFDNQTRSVEVHVFDFNDQCYGRRLEVAFVARLRGERRFADVDALVAQIRRDIAAARRIFETHGR
jgi:riboflavin kinase/FMN adenylyltransferase